jgi:multidrug efflux pump subunit AcrA (membrane-fusion protein)
MISRSNIGEHADVLTVPATAVVTEQDKSDCVAAVGGKAVRRPVQVGLSDGTWTEVVSGLDGSEKVVKAYAISLIDGQPVDVIEPAPPSAASAKP